MSDELKLEKELESRLTHHLHSSKHRMPPRLEASIRYSLLAPGKRIRPRLLLEAAEMIGLSREAAWGPAVALEMIHCFTLIHDDLPCMDDDDFRRGRPSNHKQFDESTALLAGDGLMGLAIDSLLDSEKFVEAGNIVRALRRFAEAIGPRGVVGGQAAEPDLAGAGASLPALRSMHARKTGALFDASLLIPADLAGIQPSDPRHQALARFSDALGSAFQVADDLEDAGTETRESVSILDYLSADEAAGQTRDQLESACRDLESAFGAAPAARLVAIAREVSSRLRA